MGCLGNGEKTDAVEMSSNGKDEDEKPIGKYGKKRFFYIRWQTTIRFNLILLKRESIKFLYLFSHICCFVFAITLQRPSF